VSPVTPYGFIESLDSEAILAMIIGHFDESGKHRDDPVITFAGVAASYAKVKLFDEDWEIILRKYGLKSLHAVKAIRPSQALGKLGVQTLSERIEALKSFVDCINKHMELVLMLAWDVAGFQEMSPTSLNKIGNPDTPHYIAFTRGMLKLVDYYHRQDDKVNLVCDDDEETSEICYYHYKALRNVYRKARKRVISITFANDYHYPALQAADLVALLCRLDAHREFHGTPYDCEPLLTYAVQPRTLPSTQWLKQFSDRTVSQGLSDALDKNNDDH